MPESAVYSFPGTKAHRSTRIVAGCHPGVKKKSLCVGSTSAASPSIDLEAVAGRLQNHGTIFMDRCGEGGPDGAATSEPSPNGRLVARGACGGAGQPGVRPGKSGVGRGLDQRREKAAVGFEPTNNGFANRRLRPLGYAAVRDRPVYSVLTAVWQEEFQGWGHCFWGGGRIHLSRAGRRNSRT